MTVGARYHHHNVHFEKLEITNFPLSGEIFATAPAALGLRDRSFGSGRAARDRALRCRRRGTSGSTGRRRGTFQPLPSLTPPFPSDLAQTTTIDGNTVNYIVRVESGVINESIYRIAILDDPTTPISNPWSAGGKKPGPGWNGKLTWPFGGGASPAFRSGQQRRSHLGAAGQPLSLGFAVAFGTRNTLGTGCDDVVSAETLMMIKERFIEQYGVPKFTIGSGGSGGAIQQHLIAHNYPGLLDALTPGISIRTSHRSPPTSSTAASCNNYFNNIANPADWPAAGAPKVDGYASATSGPTAGQTLQRLGGLRRRRTGRTRPTGFDPVVPLDARYDPVTNPTGARGTFWDGNVNALRAATPRPASRARPTTTSACSTGSRR